MPKITKPSGLIKSTDKDLQELNREGWLTQLAFLVQPLFMRLQPLPSYKVTCGWPCVGGMSTKGGRRVGECHAARTSKAGLYEIFISPVLEVSLEVAGVVMHELCHVSAGVDAKHGKDFTKVTSYVGLNKGKPTHVLPGEKLNEQLKKIIEQLGPYPHSAIVGEIKEKKKRQGLIPLLCTQCACKVLISARWLDEAGAPTCACGGLMEQLEGGE
jgi:hypothetical protein